MIDRYDFAKGSLDEDGMERVKRLGLRETQVTRLCSHHVYNLRVKLSNNYLTEEYIDKMGSVIVLPVFNAGSFSGEPLEFMPLREGHQRKISAAHGEFHRRRDLRISPGYDLMALSPVFPFHPERTDEQLFGEDGPLLQLANINAVNEVIWRKIAHYKDLPVVDPIGFITEGSKPLLYVFQQRHLKLKQYAESQRAALLESFNRELDDKGYTLVHGSSTLKDKVVDEHKGKKRVLVSGFPNFVKAR